MVQERVEIDDEHHLFLAAKHPREELGTTGAAGSKHGWSGAKCARGHTKLADDLIDTEPDDAAADRDDDQLSQAHDLRVSLALKHAEALAEIDHRNDDPTQCDDALDDVGGVRDGTHRVRPRLDHLFDPHDVDAVDILTHVKTGEFQDVIIDLVCFRKFGHNEGDEPTFTQPDMYRRIKERKGVRELYEQRLLARGTVTEQDLVNEREALKAEFEVALDKVRSKNGNGNGIKHAKSPMHGVWENYAGGPDADVPDADTTLPAKRLDELSERIVAVPETFKLHRKLQRFVKELGEMTRGEAPLSWAAAEHMAYASLLTEGHSVRISGQDAIRGTFTHRHVGWTDSESGVRYFAMKNLSEDQGRFDCYNSPLSEFGVLGFEFGYSLASPDTLLIWEAQFGDFANGAQVIIDQFLSSSEDKWNRISGLVMFLPHGYEGQGPEHSSARLERFLQLCAEDNMQVCNLTTPAQMFHALRRQIHRKWRKPLIIMTPKSLLRTRQSFSPREELSDGGFQRLIDDKSIDDKGAKKVRRLMFCSGKIYYDLLAHREELGRNDVALIRLEQFYPFPTDAVSYTHLTLPTIYSV